MEFQSKKKKAEKDKNVTIKIVSQNTKRVEDKIVRYRRWNDTFSPFLFTARAEITIVENPRN